MAERLEWELVPMVKSDRHAEVEALATEILDLDAKLEAAPERMTPAEQTRLIDLQKRMSQCVVSPCEAAGTPLLRARPRWKEESAVVYRESGCKGEVSLDDFLQVVGGQHDCALCDGASAYPGVSGIPCEFDLTPLAQVLADESVLEQIQFELEPREMEALAVELEGRARSKAAKKANDIDPGHYLSDAVRFLRYWARLGFGVAPAHVDSE
jgi:hypothetical protein